RIVGVQLWKLGDGGEGAVLLKGHKLAVDSVAFSHNLEMFASVAHPEGFDKPAEVKVCDLAGGAVRVSAKQPIADGYWLRSSFSDDGKLLIVEGGELESTTTVLSVEHGLKVVGTAPRPSAVISADGKWVLLLNTKGAELREAATFHHRGSF